MSQLGKNIKVQLKMAHMFRVSQSSEIAMGS